MVFTEVQPAPDSSCFEKACYIIKVNDVLVFQKLLMSSFFSPQLLCIIGDDYVRGIIVLVTCGLAGYVLLTSLWKGLEKDNNKIGLITLVCLALLHIAFAFAFLVSVLLLCL